MKIIIFGATGTVGQELVKQAIAQGHQVTAFVRNPEKMQHAVNTNLMLYKGDVLNAKQVEDALKNQDTVLCVLGDGRTGTIRAAGTKTIIEAMENTGIKRLICQTTLGMGESYANLNFVWKHIMFGMLLKKAFADHKLQEYYILNSDLDYSIVRPSAFTDGEITNQFKIGFDGNLKGLNLKISRADVANFMLQQVLAKEYLKKAVSISN